MAQRREEFVNNAQTTLNGSISDSATSVVVTDGSVFPSTGDFHLLIESELVLCTARSTNTLTVVRAQEGTTNVGHADGIRVYQLLTQGDLQRYCQDNDPLFDGGRPAFRIIDANENILTASDFTLQDWGSGGAVKSNSGSSIVLVTNTLINAALTRPVPVTPTWQLTAAVRGVSKGPSSDGNVWWSGASIGVMDTAGKIVCQNYWSHKKQANVNKWDTSHSYVWPDVITTYDCPVLDWMWFRIRRPNDGNWYFDISDNGKFWLNVGAYGESAYLGTIDRIFFGAINPAIGGWATLAAWDDGAGILGS
ncbi:MAG: hypothetical protein ABSH20_31800 [Tepidisphaeraceae bacterium]